MFNREQLTQMNSWAGIVGILNIVFGALSALSGIFAFLIGAIPGVLMIIAGVKLRNAKSGMDALLMQAEGADNTAALNEMAEGLIGYFKMSAIFYIASIVMGVLFFILMMVMGIGMMSYMGGGLPQ